MTVEKLQKKSSSVFLKKERDKMPKYFEVVATNIFVFKVKVTDEDIEEGRTHKEVAEQFCKDLYQIWPDIADAEKTKITSRKIKEVRYCKSSHKLVS